MLGENWNGTMNKCFWRLSIWMDLCVDYLVSINSTECERVRKSFRHSRNCTPNWWHFFNSICFVYFIGRILTMRKTSMEIRFFNFSFCFEWANLSAFEVLWFFVCSFIIGPFVNMKLNAELKSFTGLFLLCVFFLLLHIYLMAIYEIDRSASPLMWWFDVDDAECHFIVSHFLLIFVKTLFIFFLLSVNIWIIVGSAKWRNCFKKLCNQSS